MLNFNPLEQFELRDFLFVNVLDSISLSITNISFYLVISLIIIINLFRNTTLQKRIIDTPYAYGAETISDTVNSIVENQISKTDGQKYIPFIFSIFIFILVNNLIGMVPYSFSPTSHFILTFSMSFSIVLGATILGFGIHKLKFFSLFVPAGCPLALLPLLVIIEFISYLARPISLGLRLAANVLSGHMLLHILSGFTYKIMKSGILYLVLGVLPLLFIIAFSTLEIAIAFIQAQVFVVLSCGYIKDALYLH